MITPFTLPTHFKPAFHTFAAQTPAAENKGSSASLWGASSGPSPAAPEVSLVKPLQQDAVQFGMTTAEDGDSVETADGVQKHNKELLEIAVRERASMEALYMLTLLYYVGIYYNNPRDAATLAQEVNDEIRKRIARTEFGDLLPALDLPEDPAKITQYFKRAFRMFSTFSSREVEESDKLKSDEFDLFDRDSLHSGVTSFQGFLLMLNALHYVEQTTQKLLETDEYKELLDDKGLEAAIVARRNQK